ncbi:MAG: Rrf2 family transcriptional regulator [Bacillota bacterium]
MITNKTEYLLLTLINLARRRKADNELISSRTIAEEEKIPLNYMPQLMSILTKKGWVESVRGLNGGVRLIADPKEITVQDVITVSEDILVIKKCVFDGCSFGLNNCRLRPLWLEAQKRVDEVMGSTTIEDLLKNSTFQ